MAQDKLTVATQGDREVVFTRAFAASRQMVFDCMTKPDLVKRWLLGPPGWTMPVCEIDLRVGGKWRYAMVTPDGTEVAFHGYYVEIVPDELVVAKEIYEGAEDFSEEELNTQRFEDAGEGRVSEASLARGGPPRVREPRAMVAPAPDRCGGNCARLRPGP